VGFYLGLLDWVSFLSIDAADKVMEPSNLPALPDARQDLVRFINAARSKGATDEFIAKLLKNAGWSQREIERAFYEVYEQLTGLAFPSPRGSTGESARDAFVYLLAFSTLGIWAQALGQLAFIFIDQTFPDTVTTPFYGADPSFQVAFCIARLMVAYPVYLLVMRQIIKDLKLYREKNYSGVRKWLTFLTLLIVCLIGIGTLITFLTSFLRGELTLRFACKILVVLLIDGGVLWYYSASLKRRPMPINLV
jgi:Domain of unknown function (DUF5671)